MKDNALGTHASPLRTLLLDPCVRACLGTEVPKEKEDLAGSFITASFRALAPCMDGKWTSTHSENGPFLPLPTPRKWKLHGSVAGLSAMGQESSYSQTRPCHPPKTQNLCSISRFGAPSACKRRSTGLTFLFLL